jgi:hypothetical protein
VIGQVPGKKDHTERLANGEKGHSLGALLKSRTCKLKIYIWWCVTRKNLALGGPWEGDNSWKRLLLPHRLRSKRRNQPKEGLARGLIQP